MDSRKKVYVARQPIFNTEKEVVAYELLFRSGLENYFSGDIDAETATSKVMSDTLHILGIDQLVEDKKAFINFSEKLLLSDTISIFPQKTLVVEILEHVEPTEDVVKACQRLKKQGYVIALDDFVFDEKFLPLMDLCDVIKVDFMISGEQERREIILKAGDRNIQFLAEKVETLKEFESASEMGYSLFQGYFFSKPQIVEGQDIPAHKLSFLEIIKEVNQPDFNFKVVESIIKRDVSLTYKLLRFINSAGFGLKSEVKNIRHALAILGENELKKWISLVSVASLGEDKPAELVFNSMVRAMFLESFAELSGKRTQKSDYFLLGLFSLIDALLDKPKEAILKDLPISENIKTALIENSGPLYPPLAMFENYEKANWEEITSLEAQLNIDEQLIPELYSKVLTRASEYLEH